AAFPEVCADDADVEALYRFPRPRRNTASCVARTCGSMSASNDTRVAKKPIQGFYIGVIRAHLRKCGVWSLLKRGDHAISPVIEPLIAEIARSHLFNQRGSTQHDIVSGFSQGTLLITDHP